VGKVMMLMIVGGDGGDGGDGRDRTSDDDSIVWYPLCVCVCVGYSMTMANVWIASPANIPTILMITTTTTPTTPATYTWGHLTPPVTFSHSPFIPHYSGGFPTPPATTLELEIDSVIHLTPPPIWGLMDHCGTP